MLKKITTYILIFINGICMGYLWNYHHESIAMKQLTSIQIEQAHNMQPSNWCPANLTKIPKQ